MAQRLPRHLDAERERIAWEQKLASILLEVGEPAPKNPRGKGPGRMVGYRSSENDLQRLRALPAVAPGVPGAIPGTDPVRALLAKERRRSRH